MSVMDFIYALVIVAILVTAVLIKYRNRNIRGEWILVSFLIGILSLPIGLYLAQIIGANQIFSIILIFIILSICYTYLKKESPAFFIKILIVSFLISLIVFVSWFEIGAYYEHQEGAVISVNQYDTASGEYVDITKYMEEYPLLNKAIKGEGCEKFGEKKWHCKSPPSDEWRRSVDFISKQNARLYKIGEKYYELSFGIS
jgi:hypothetical protein